MKTQVAIVGAGPAGLMLGHLLRAEGIECIVIERQSPDYVLSRIRAGVLEQVTVGVMERLGLDARLKREGLVEDGFSLADGERLIRIDVAALTGKTVVVYGQTEIQRDLMDAAPERGLDVVYFDKYPIGTLDHASAITQIPPNKIRTSGKKHISR